MCSASTQGIYIKIMCVFHKSDQYGGILLKQKDKQNEQQILNFAYRLARLLPFTETEVTNAVAELVDEGVLTIDDDFLYQKRMVKDGQTSDARSKSGKSGGEKTASKFKESNNFAKAKHQANSEANLQQNTEYENEYDNAVVITSIEKVSKKKPIQHSEESSEVMQWFISSFDTVAFDWNDAAMNRARQGIDRSIKRLQNKPENKGLTKDETIAMLKGIIKFVKDDAFWGTQFETPAKLMTNDKNGLNWLDRFINLYRQKSPELAKQRRDAETDRLIRNDEAQRERMKHEESQF